MKKKRLTFVILFIIILPIAVVMVAYFAGPLKPLDNNKSDEKALKSEIEKYDELIKQEGAAAEKYVEMVKQVIKDEIYPSRACPITDSIKYNPLDIGIYLLNEAISLEPDNQEAHYWLGVAYQKHEGPLINNKFPCSIKNTKLASQQFKEVIKISPYYNGEVNVNGPYGKLTTVWGMYALNNLVNDRIEKAKWAFEQGVLSGGFNWLQLQLARNFLNSCEQDAVLFTNGDMDTFPLMFVQWIEGLRKDVAIVNLSLLNTTWYIKYLKNKIKITIELSDKDIDNLRFEKAGEKIIRIQDIMLKHIIDNTDILKHTEGETEYTPPIYFAVTVSPRNKMDYEYHLAMEGLVYRLVSTESDKQVSKDRLAYNLTKVYDYDGLLDSNNTRYDECIKLMQNYLTAFMTLALEQKKDGEVAKAISTMEYASAVLPYNWRMEAYLGSLYSENSGIEKTEKTYQQCISKDKNNPDLYRVFADIFIRNGEKKRGLKILQYGYEQFPENENLFKTMAYYYHDWGMEDEYNGLINDWLKRHPEDEDLYGTMLEEDSKQ